MTNLEKLGVSFVITLLLAAVVFELVIIGMVVYTLISPGVLVMIGGFICMWVAVYYHLYK